MKIPVRVTQQGAANWHEESVEIAKPVEQWTEPDLYQLCDKMQWFIGGNNPIRMCQKIVDQYRIAVMVEGRKAETIELLPLTDALAASTIWARKNRYRVTFDVDGECWWEPEAHSEEEALAMAVDWFRADPYWARRYPETPHRTIEKLPARTDFHGDVGPFA